MLVDVGVRTQIQELPQDASSSLVAIFGIDLFLDEKAIDKLGFSDCFDVDEYVSDQSITSCACGVLFRCCISVASCIRRAL